MDSQVKRAPKKRQIKLRPIGACDNSPQDILLCSRLLSWREEAAVREWGLNFPTAGLGIISDCQIERIVGLARLGVLSDIHILNTQLTWWWSDKFSAEVIAIVHAVWPLLLHPTQAPKGTKRKATNSSIPLDASGASSHTLPAPQVHRRPPTCSLCNITGHTGKYTN